MSNSLIDLLLKNERTLLLLDSSLDETRKEQIIKDIDLKIPTDSPADPRDVAFFLYQGYRFSKLVPDSFPSKEECLKLFASCIIENKEKIGKEQISYSRNPVYVPIGREKLLKTTLAFKISEDEESLRKELENTNKIRRILGQKYQGKRFFVPIPISIEEFKEDSKTKYAYCMQIIYIGKPLIGKKPKRFSKIEFHLERIVDFLALIHEEMPKPQNSHYDFEYDKREISKGLGFLNIKDSDESKIKEFIENYLEFYKKMIEQNSHLLVFNKDAHLGNWIIAPNNCINALDFESRGIVLPEYDLIKLLNDYPIRGLDFSVEQQIISKYWQLNRQNYGYKGGVEDKDINESMMRYQYLKILRFLLNLRSLDTSNLDLTDKKQLKKSIQRVTRMCHFNKNIRNYLDTLWSSFNSYCSLFKEGLKTIDDYLEKEYEKRRSL